MTQSCDTHEEDGARERNGLPLSLNKAEGMLRDSCVLLQKVFSSPQIFLDPAGSRPLSISPSESAPLHWQDSDARRKPGVRSAIAFRLEPLQIRSEKNRLGCAVPQAGRLAGAHTVFHIPHARQTDAVKQSRHDLWKDFAGFFVASRVPQPS